MCDCCFLCIQESHLTGDETSEQLPMDKCVLAYAVILKQVFSFRHDLSIEGLLGGYVIQVILFSQCLCAFHHGM